MDRNHALNNYIKHERIFDIQVHGWTHADYSKMSEDAVAEDLIKTKEFIKWKYGVEAKYFYPPWNIDSQEARRGAARAGLIFDNHRVESMDYIRGDQGRTVNLHYWNDYGVLDQILRRETDVLSAPRKKFNHEIMWNLGQWIPQGGSVLMTGATHVFSYRSYLPFQNFQTVDIDASTSPTHVRDITQPMENMGLYDAVLFFGVYEVVSDPTAAIRNCEALVKNGGLMIIGAPLDDHEWGKGVYRGGDIHGLSSFKCDEKLSIALPNYLIGVYRK